MTFCQKRLPARGKSVAIGIFLFLITNQWIYLFRFHYQNKYPSEPSFHPHHGTNNATTNKGDPPQHLQSPEIEVVNEVIHRAFFGLGHRFHRSTAAYHLAESLSLSRNPVYSTSKTNRTDDNLFQQQPTITHFRFHWESCLPADASIADDGDKEYNVFRYLFGEDVWKLNFKEKESRASHGNPVATKRTNENNKGRGARPQISRNMLVIRNDVPGYIAGQLYKDLQLPVSYNSNESFSRTKKSNISLSTPMASNQYEVILDKVMRSDVDFYQRLLDTYQFTEELRDFQIKHKWNERPVVVGLHLRAGNGEDAHFAESGRASSLDVNESTMIARLIRLTKMAINREIKRLKDQQEDMEQIQQALRPLLFVATDTAHLLPLIDGMINQGTTSDEIDQNQDAQSTAGTIDVVTWPQYHLPKNAGVTFDTLKGKGEECLQGWRSAMSDMLLLSTVDVLIAAKRSTFTQSLPITLGFDRNYEKNNADGMKDAIFSDTRDDKDSNNAGKMSEELITSRNTGFSFCEVSELDFVDMTCFVDARSWLFRGKDDHGVNNSKLKERMWSFSIANTTSGDSDKNHSHHEVEHKVTILLPDVNPPSEFDGARGFLWQKNAIASKQVARGTEIEESVFKYGRSKINQKYRNSHKMNPKTNSRSWHFVLNSNF